jgi:hypothetical protein
MNERFNTFPGDLAPRPLAPEQALEVGSGVLPLVTEYPVAEVTNGGGNYPFNDNAGKPFGGTGN